MAFWMWIRWPSCLNTYSFSPLSVHFSLHLIRAQSGRSNTYLLWIIHSLQRYFWSPHHVLPWALDGRWCDFESWARSWHRVSAGKMPAIYYSFTCNYATICEKERQDSCFKLRIRLSQHAFQPLQLFQSCQTYSSASIQYHSEVRALKAQKSEAIVLWKTSPSEEIVLRYLLEHFTLHWEAIKTITRSLVKVIVFFFKI